MSTSKVTPGFRIQSRRCMVTLGRAIRENWQMDEATRDSIVRQLTDIVEHDVRDRWVLRASDLIVLMDAQNNARLVSEGKA